MEDEKEENKEFLFGNEYANFETERNETGGYQAGTGFNNPRNNNRLMNINEIEEHLEKHPQTELNKNPQKIKDRINHKMNNEKNSSSDKLPKVLQKKTSRIEGPKKKRRTKTKMDITLKSKTEVASEDKKKNYFQEFTHENFYDLYDPKPSDSGDLFNDFNNDDPNAEVNKIMPSYSSVINNSIPESFDMVISENQ
jgi:hypothetical protein